MNEPLAPALCVTDLSERYGNVQALRSISFEVPAGACFGLIGANGAGKTTCIKLLLGVGRGELSTLAWAGSCLPVSGPTISSNSPRR